MSLFVLVLAACSPERPIPPTAIDWTPEGPSIATDAGDLQLAPTRWGRPGALSPIVLGTPTRVGDRQVYASDGLDAWFAERPDGLQQGFDVHSPPPGDGLLELRVRLTDRPIWVEDALYWTDDTGAVRARYAGLQAWDADHTELPTRFGLVCTDVCEAVLRVDDTGARYPLVVDPVLATDHTTSDLPDDIETVGVYGGAVDMDGDRLALWNIADGEVLLFERHGLNWEALQVISAADWPESPTSFGRALSLEGDTLIVGMQDAVYVYGLVGDVWTPRAEIEKPDDGLVESGLPTYGLQVELSGDTLALGVSGLSLVYLFDRDPTTGVWSHSETIQGTEGFARGVQLEGDRLFVPQVAPNADLHVYERSGGVWSPATVVAPSFTGNTSLTRLVSAFRGDRAAVTRWYDKTVYVLDRDASGVWTETFTGADGSSQYATAIELLDDVLVVGHPSKGSPGVRDVGQVELWGYDGTWSLETTLDPDELVEYGAFGTKLTGDGAWLAVLEPRRYSLPRFVGHGLHFYVITPEDVDGDGYASVANGGLDCDDLDGSVSPAATEVPGNTIDEDCDGYAASALSGAAAGDLVITEIHASPWLDGAAAPQGAWIELYNASAEAWLLDGLVLTSDSGTETLSTSAAVGPGQRVVLAASAVGLDNGGFVPDATWATFSLATTGVLSVSGAVVLDAVDLTGWTVPTGASLALDPAVLDASANDAESAWCEAIASYGENFGTPGSANVCQLDLDIQFHWVLPDGSTYDGATTVTVAMDGTLTTGNQGTGTGSWSTTSAGQTVTWTYDGTAVTYVGTRDHGAACFAESTMTGLPGATAGYWSEVGCACVTTGDADGDGVCDGDDVCPGSDDRDDDDGDGVPNGCDVCLAGDDDVDTDKDGFADACDICPGYRDNHDADGDGVPDGCDRCPGEDDTGDADGDAVPDACDICALGDDALDDDDDDVPDACDICALGDDALDADSDGVPDACDICAGSDDTADADSDGTPDGCDLCPGGDDSVDVDRDGIPDACDPCTVDMDHDDVCDDVDACIGWDDAIDSDGDGIPDGCDDDDDCKADGSGAWTENPYFAGLVEGDPTIHVVSGLRPGACWTATGTAGATVTVKDCDGSTDQDWTWSASLQTFVHSSGLCLDASGTEVVLATCDGSQPAVGPDELGRIGLEDCSACLSAQDLVVDTYTLKPVPCEAVDTDFGQRWGIDVQRDYPSVEILTDENISTSGVIRRHVSVWGPYARAISRVDNGNAYVAVGSTRGNGRVAVISGIGLDAAGAAAQAWVDAAPGTSQTYSFDDDMDVDAVLAHVHAGGGVVLGTTPPFLYRSPHPVYTTYDPKAVVLREAGLSGMHRSYSGVQSGDLATAQPMPADTRYDNMTGAIELSARTVLGLESADVDDLANLVYSAATASLNVSNLEPIVVYTEALHRAMGYPEVTQASPNSWTDADSFDDIVLLARFFRTMSLYPDQADAPAGAADYPGVPSDTEPRVTATVTIDPSTRPWQWIPTGYYAPPGEPVAVMVDGAVDDEVFLYAHWTIDWIMPRACQLCPNRVARFPAAGGSLLLEDDGQGLLNAPLGGPIFLMAKQTDAPVTLTLANVLPQPRFQVGIDTDASLAAQLAATTVPLVLMEDPDVVFLGHKTEIEAATDSHTAIVTMLGDLLRAQRDFSHQPGWSPPTMFFFDVEAGNDGAHDGNPGYLSHSYELRTTNPFWQTHFFGKWGYLHEAGHGYARQYKTPFYIELGKDIAWREGEPNFLQMAAVDEMFGDGSHSLWDDYDDTERQVRRDAFVCTCLDAGGCTPRDHSTREVVDIALNLVDDPNIGWDGVSTIYAAWTHPGTDAQDHVDQLATLLSDTFDRDFGPYLTAYQMGVSSDVLTAIDAAHPIDWEADPFVGLVCP